MGSPEELMHVSQRELPPHNDICGQEEAAREAETTNRGGRYSLFFPVCLSLLTLGTGRRRPEKAPWTPPAHLQS